MSDEIQANITETADEEDGELTDDVKALTKALERLVPSDVSGLSDEDLGRLAGAIKELESVAEDARKEVAEAELSERVDVGSRAGPVSRHRGSRSYVTDDAGAFDAVLEAGHDPREVASVKASVLQDVLGSEADEFLGESEYTYFRR